MTTKTVKQLAANGHSLQKLLTLAALFAITLVSILALRGLPAGEGEFEDSVAREIAREMEENQIVLSGKGGLRKAADFRESILLAHGKDARLIVYTAELSEAVALASEGWGGYKWNSTYQEVKYFGQAEYTVDLSQLSQEDLQVNNEQKLLTVRIPYATLTPIRILDDKTQFKDAERGWLGPKDVELTPEQHGKLMLAVKEKMKAQLLDREIPTKANEAAKTAVAELLTAAVQSVDPEFSVVVVF